MRFLTDEEKALDELRRNPFCGGRNANFTRVRKYEVLDPGNMFFRDGKGKAYSIHPGSSHVHTFDEAFLEEDLALRKYRSEGELLRQRELDDFFASDSFAELKCKKGDVKAVAEKVNTIRAAFAALGYNKDWLREMFVPQLAEKLVEE